MIFKRLTSTVAFLLAIYGLYEIGEKIWDKTQNGLLTLVIIGAIIFLILTYHFISYLSLPFVHRFYGIDRNTDRVVIKGNQILKVNKKGLLEVDTYRTYFFLKTPEPSDLNDTIMVNNEFKDSDNITEFYTSNDSTIEGVKKRKKNRLVINWKPKDYTIVPYKEYEHNYKWWPKGVDFSQDRNYYLFNGLFPQTNFKAVLETKRKIKEYWVIEKPKFKPYLTGKKLEKYIRKKKSFNVSQPVRISENRIEWELQGADKPNSFILYWLYNTDKKGKKS